MPHEPITDPAITQMHQHVLAALESAARTTGDPRYRLAIGIVQNWHSGGGRPGKNDRRALEDMHELIESGAVVSVEAAARRVAATLSGEHSKNSGAWRLSTKYRRLRVKVS